MSITKGFEERGLRQPPFYRDTDVHALLAHTRALEEKLKCLEWLGDDEGDMGTCPICGTAEFQGHAPDCQLAKLLEGVE